MGKVLSLNDNKKNWYTGVAFCCECKKKWFPVLQDGTDEEKLECPSCSVQNSVMINSSEIIEHSQQLIDSGWLND